MRADRDCVYGRVGGSRLSPALIFVPAYRRGSCLLVHEDVCLLSGLLNTFKTCQFSLLRDKTALEVKMNMGPPWGVVEGQCPQTSLDPKRGCTDLRAL